MQHKHLRFSHGLRAVLGEEYSHSAQTTVAHGEVQGGPTGNSPMA